MNGKHLNEGLSTHSNSKLLSESEAGILFIWVSIQIQFV